MPRHTVEEIIAERMNETLTGRFDQLSINILGLHGGRPYVEERLSRFPGEDSVDWEGGTRKDGSVITGRLEQAHCIPYLGRIADKIDQFVLGKKPERGDIATEVEEDITRDGLSINELMKQVNDFVTACRWTWIGIDAPAIEDPRKVSVADKETGKLRPFWRHYSPLSVVDWHFDEMGKLQWVLVEEWITDNSNPRAKAVSRKVRRLWELGGTVTTYFFDLKNPDRIATTLTQVDEVSLKTSVPFVLVGEISDDPYQFDNLESVNRSIMDLESCNRQNFFNSVFAQAHLPIEALDAIKDNFNVTADEAVLMLTGFNYPIFTTKDSTEPGFIMPDAAAIGTMGTELTRLRGELFETVGLMLRQETKQVASADAKAWDFLDIAAVMNERANILETAEKKAVAISKEWDGDFVEWEPVYNRDFAQRNFKEEIASLVMAANVNMPDEMLRILLAKLNEALQSVGSDEISSDDKEAAIEALKTFGAPTFPMIIDPVEE